jgi:protein-disulfide isomerase
MEKIAGYAVTLVVLTVTLSVAFPDYWNMELDFTDAHIPSGLTNDGHPWIGAEKPELTIIEFSDYQCFQCKKMHLYLRQLIVQHPDKIRLIHRHFPMDHSVNPIVKDPFHIGSGKLSLLALFALEKGKFWEVNDLLFNLDNEKETLSIRKIAAAVDFDVLPFAGSIHHPYLQHKLKVDILTGIKLGVTGTPGFLIDDKIYLGEIPADLLAGFKLER